MRLETDFRLAGIKARLPVRNLVLAVRKMQFHLVRALASDLLFEGLALAVSTKL